MKGKKTVGISLRIDDEMHDRIVAFETSSGVGKTTLIINAITATLDYYEKQGYIRFPIKVVDSSITTYPAPSEASQKVAESDNGNDDSDVEDL